MAKKKNQRVRYDDALKMLEKKLNKTVNSTTYEYDHAGGSEAFINEYLVKQFLKKLTR